MWWGMLTLVDFNTKSPTAGGTAQDKKNMYDCHKRACTEVRVENNPIMHEAKIYHEKGF